jgi:hypothetical protein
MCREPAGARIEATRRRCDMTTTSHEPTRVASERRGWSELLVSEMWASLAIAVIWIAVLFDAIYGPDIMTRGVAGDSSVIPSAVIVSVFAFLATWVVAKYGLKRDRATDERKES